MYFLIERTNMYIVHIFLKFQRRKRKGFHSKNLRRQEEDTLNFSKPLLLFPEAYKSESLTSMAQNKSFFSSLLRVADGTSVYFLWFYIVFILFGRCWKNSSSGIFLLAQHSSNVLLIVFDNYFSKDNKFKVTFFLTSMLTKWAQGFWSWNLSRISKARMAFRHFSFIESP